MFINGKATYEWLLEWADWSRWIIICSLWLMQDASFGKLTLELEANDDLQTVMDELVRKDDTRQLVILLASGQVSPVTITFHHHLVLLGVECVPETWIAESTSHHSGRPQFHRKVANNNIHSLSPTKTCKDTVQSKFIHMASPRDAILRRWNSSKN